MSVLCVWKSDFPGLVTIPTILTRPCRPKAGLVLVTIIVIIKMIVIMTTLKMTKPLQCEFPTESWWTLACICSSATWESLSPELWCSFHNAMVVNVLLCRAPYIWWWLWWALINLRPLQIAARTRRKKIQLRLKCWSENVDDQWLICPTTGYQSKWIIKWINS